MVMMHELAHNLQMNHSKFFWIERNKFSADLKLLWQKGYLGDGLYGVGRTTEEGRRVEANTVVLEDENSPLALCGGTYRSRRRARKRKRDQADLAWKEKEQRRIERKFGKAGVQLGGDEESRVAFEKGKKPKGKPRVAGSNRGRELRAAAALARYTQQKLPAEVKEEHEMTSSGSDYDDDTADETATDAKDVNGARMLDVYGHGLVKVCENEKSDEVEFKRELEELDAVHKECTRIKREQGTEGGVESGLHPSITGPEQRSGMLSKREDLSLADIPLYQEPETFSNPSIRTARASIRSPAKSTITMSTPSVSTSPSQEPRGLECVSSRPGSVGNVACKVCSMANDRLSPTCIACANVLDVRKVASFWRCQSDACKGSAYINAGDCGVCGVCGFKQAA